MTTPVGDVVLSISFKPAGTVPSSNSRFPDPTTTGNVFRCYSSMVLARINVCKRFALPWTCSSGPSCCFILRKGFDNVSCDEFRIRWLL
jgi:hypothetical protein